MALPLERFLCVGVSRLLSFGSQDDWVRSVGGYLRMADECTAGSLVTVFLTPFSLMVTVWGRASMIQNGTVLRSKSFFEWAGGESVCILFLSCNKRGLLKNIPFTRFVS